MTASDRALFLTEMKAGVGLTAAPATLAAFELWLGGAEKPAMRRALATYRYRNPVTGVETFSSTCGVGIRDAMRRAGFTARWLQPDYVPSTVMSDLKAEGQRAHAVTLATPSSLPAPGDVVGLAWANPAAAHVLVVETDPQVAEDGTVTFDAVEAGQQTPAQLQACARKRHTWRWDARAKRYYDRSVALEPATLLQGGEREVSWWIDMSKLPAGGPRSPFDASPPPLSGDDELRPMSFQIRPGTAPVLRRGATGEAVRTWQKVIGATADGIFGPGTESRTRVWQAAHGLTADGVVGPASWRVAGVEAQASPTPASATPIEGIDVSSIQGVIDWERVAAAGIRFAYVRTVIGLDTRDAMRAVNAARARKAGIELGLYGVCYPRHGRAQDAAQQAAQLAADHKASGATLRPMIDFESLADVPDATPQEWLAALDEYCDGLEAAGLSPILYTYPSFWRSMSGWTFDARWAAYPLWLAHYTKAGQPDVPPPWTRALVWQYAASAPGFEGRVDGVPGLVDRNRLFGSLDDLRAR